MEKNDENRRASGLIWKLLLAVFVIGCGVSVAFLVIGNAKQKQAQRELEELASRYTVDASAPTESSAEPSGEPAEVEPQEEPDPYEALREAGVEIPEREVDFEALQADTNKDIYAWIYIPDTAIDYPVLQHETNNLYYLEYNLDGSKGYPGCIYTENYNTKDFTDPVTVLYGHNMKNGTMFAGLHKYEDADYFAEHPYVYVYTPEGLLVYQIFAACLYSDKHILLNFDFSEQKSYETFLEEVTSVRGMNNNYNEDVEVTAEDRVLVLSTCVSTKPTNRYLVLGVLLNED